MRDTIINLISTAFKNKFNIDINVYVDIPKQKEADYSVNTCLQIAKTIGKSPIDIAKEIVSDIKSKEFEKIEAVLPGFIYFTLSKESLINLIINKDENWGNSNEMNRKKLMVEFAHPNTHKAFHIGHLRNISLGESIVRLLESQGAKIFRANYQGDIGPHVAKCIWALLKKDEKEIKEISLKTPKIKAEYLGKVYQEGGKAYENNEIAKNEIQEINKSIYHKSDQKIMKLYENSRTWSLEYFDYIYNKLGTPTFDHLFFESEVWELGKKIVEKNLNTIFTKSNGAIVFNGEKYGLHTRVFISAEGNPTYEGKEIGLAVLEKETFSYDENIHVVANEQAAYFTVVFEAMFQLFPELRGKQKHLSYGMVNLTTGKMSSRTGDVITAESLLDDAKERIHEILKDRDFTDEEKELISEIVSIGAIKFTMLHTMAKNDIAFDMDKAVKIEGDSGPYLQYAYARICSIIKKVDFKSSIQINHSLFNEFDWKLLKCIQYFPYHVSRCAKEMSTHYLTHYLLKLVAEFSSWYDKNSVMKSETENLKLSRIKLLQLLQLTLKKGLYLLGIETVDRM